MSQRLLSRNKNGMLTWSFKRKRVWKIESRFWMWKSNAKFWHCRESNHWVSEWNMCFNCTLQCLSNYLSHGEHTASSVPANHRMERFSKNDSWVILHKITSSSTTLSEGSRQSFRICLANETFSGEIFGAHLIPGMIFLSPNGSKWCS